MTTAHEDAAIFDLVLAFDAHERMGFGHASRCIQIAELVAVNHPGLRVAVVGELAPRARGRVLMRLPRAGLLSPLASPRGRVAVVDRLADHEDPESLDVPLVERLARTNVKVFALATGARTCTLPSNAVLVGYQPGTVTGNGRNVYWGLEYAPVASSMLPREGPPRPGRVLVTLGGAEDDRCLRNVLLACARLEGVEAMDVLLSPAMRVDAARIVELDARIVLHQDVPSVAPLIAAAEIVVTSYGHSMWEAIAAGSAICVFGQKDFQVAWAERLAASGVVVAGGDARSITPHIALRALRATRDRATPLRERASKFVDGKGLFRVARLVSATLGPPSAIEAS
jgi:spore coat polysaccharide biosynthesis predicted glycosyltransferase SpsG